MDCLKIIRGIKIFITLGVVLTLFHNAARAQQQDLESSVAEADTLMAHEDFEGALNLYNKILDKTTLTTPDSYNVLYKRAVCYYQMNNFQKALEDINTFIEHYPYVPQAKLLRAYIYQGLDDVEGQLKSLDELIALQPFNTELVKWQASLLLQNDQYLEAREKLKKAAQLKDDAQTQLYLGLTYYYMEDADSALLAFDKSILLDNTYTPAYLYAGSLCIEQTAYELALDYINKGLALDEQDLTLLYYKGVALVEMGKPEEGCPFLSKAFYGGNDDASGYLKEYCFK